MQHLHTDPRTGHAIASAHASTPLLLLAILLATGCHNRELATHDAPRIHIASSQEVKPTDLGQHLRPVYATGSSVHSTLGTYLLQVFDSEARTVQLHLQTNRAEHPDSAIAFVHREGFLDDSVRADWHELRFVHRDNAWHLVAIRRAHQCWRRDHTFRAAPCP